MNYTIMSTQCAHFNQMVDLSSCGNQYIVFYLYEGDGGTELRAKKYFDSLDAAVQVYMKFVDAFARSLYSNEDRASWLA